MAIRRQHSGEQWGKMGSLCGHTGATHQIEEPVKQAAASAIRLKALRKYALIAAGDIIHGGGMPTALLLHV